MSNDLHQVRRIDSAFHDGVDGVPQGMPHENALGKGLTMSLERRHNSQHGSTKKKTGDQRVGAGRDGGKPGEDEKTDGAESYWNGPQNCEWQTNERKTCGGEGVW